MMLIDLETLPLPLWELLGGAVGVLVLLVIAAFLFGSMGGRPAGGDKSELDRQRLDSRRWATPRDVRKLAIEEHDSRRLAFCEMGSGRHKVQLALPHYRSLIVMAPSGSGKTPAVVVPIVLQHDGPAVVTSVKADVLHLTRHRREQMGPVWVFDPCQTAGESVKWSPLSSIETWGDAIDVARWIQDTQQAGRSTSSEGMEHWDAQARFLLAPLLWLVARNSGTMPAVFYLLQESDEVESRITKDLEELGDADPLMFWEQYRRLHSRTKGSILTTARTVLEAWIHPRVRDAVSVPVGAGLNLDLDFIAQGKGTLYLVAPASDQEMFTPIFECMVSAILMYMERAASKRMGLPPKNPLLMMLDEAANIAPLRRLDQVCSKGASEGILTCHIWQDEAQLVTSFGPHKAATVMANSYGKLYMPGISDTDTLERVSALIGDDTFRQVSHNSGGEHNTATHSSMESRVAPVEWLQKMPTGTVIGLAGNFKPVWGRVTSWYEDEHLRSMVDPEVAKAFDDMYSTPEKKTRKKKAA